MRTLIVLALVAALALGAFFFLGSNPLQTVYGPKTSEDYSPQSKPIPGYQGSVSRTDVEIEGISSLSFRADGTYRGEPATYWFRGKNLGTQQEADRIDITKNGTSKYTVIADRTENTAWISEFGSAGWRRVTGPEFNQIWDVWRNHYLSYAGEVGPGTWKSMEGGTYTASSEEGTVRIYDIRVNEPLAEEVFRPY